MQVAVRGGGDLREKLQPFLMAIPILILFDHCPVGYVKSRTLGAASPPAHATPGPRYCRSTPVPWPKNADSTAWSQADGSTKFSPQ